MYKALVRPLLFQFDSETVHDVILGLSSKVNSRRIQRLIEPYFKLNDNCLKAEVAGLTFNNPFGLAAGFDKDCRAVPFLSALGFGSIEIGSVTGSPQAGNSKPRIFRLKKDHALINRMGFPSDGAQAVQKRLIDLKSSDCYTPILGINLGKTKIVPIDDALEDYQKSFKLLADYGDYFVLNVSSPNTPELRKLQEPDRLEALFKGIQALNKASKPIFVKVAPDLTLAELDQVLEVCFSCSIQGIIATNTTFSREGLRRDIDEVGGLSGVPLFSKSCELVQHISKQTQGKLPIVAVGGVKDITQVLDMLKAGASLIQIYTGFIYEGPFLIKKLCQGLIQYCQKEGLNSYSDIS